MDRYGRGARIAILGIVLMHVMNNLSKKITNIFDRILDLMGVAAIIILLFMMLSIAYAVIIRFLFGRGVVVLLEITEYSLLYITFLAAALVLRREGHVTMDLVINRLKLRDRAIINAITSVLGGILFLLITWYGTLVTWTQFEAGCFMLTQLRAPKGPIMLIIPIGSFLFSIQFLRRGYGFLRIWRGLRK